MNDYQRVIPRDLFNEAKLLKCLGKLSLAILDGKPALNMTEEMSGHDFRIRQNPSDGSIYVDNIRYLLNGSPIFFYTPMNCKEPWPLECETEDAETIEVFCDDGSFSTEFLELASGE